MATRLTPDGGTWRDTLASIRKSLESAGEEALRPEEVAMLEDWYICCEDADQRRQLGELMRVLGRRE